MMELISWFVSNLIILFTRAFQVFDLVRIYNFLNLKISLYLVLKSLKKKLNWPM